MLQVGVDALLGGLGEGLLAWLSPNAALIPDYGEFIFFKLVLERLQHDINVFGDRVLGRMMTFVQFVAISLLSIWVFWQGFRVLTGQMRDSLMGLVANMGKAVFIVALATSFGAANQPVTGFLTTDMKDGIHELITGKTGGPEDEIDENLAWLQVAMSSLDALETGGDVGLNDEKGRAQTWISLGTGGPAVVAGALMLMYQVAMALFIGLGPLFILCLLFDYTKGLFQKWLFYGIGTMFSLAVLSAMVSIVLSMVTDVAAAMWAADLFSTIVMKDAGGAVGFSSRAMQTGAMGMILTLLLITVPPMAANFFSGTLGNFMHYTAFGGAVAASPSSAGPAGIPASNGYQPQQPGPSQSLPGFGRDSRSDNYTTPSYASSGAAQGQEGVSGIKQGSQRRDV